MTRLQELLLGGLDRLARRLGHHRRVAVAGGWQPDRWSRADDPAPLTSADLVPYVVAAAAVVAVGRVARRNRSGRR